MSPFMATSPPMVSGSPTPNSLYPRVLASNRLRMGAPGTQAVSPSASAAPTFQPATCAPLACEKPQDTPPCPAKLSTREG